MKRIAGRLALIITLFLTISSILNSFSCIQIVQQTKPPEESPKPPTKSEPIDIEAFISTPDWQPSYTIAELTATKARIDGFFKESYYASRSHIANKYIPQDTTKLETVLDDIRGLPWSYEAGYFDCSEMSALLELYLESAGFDTVIVVGRDPAVQGPGHAWVVVFVKQPSFQAVPVEATVLSIPKSTGNFYAVNSSQVVMNYQDYLRSGWVLRDIYEAESWAPGQFDWWNTYALSFEQLFGKASTPLPPSPPPPSPPPSPPAPPPPSPKLVTRTGTLVSETINVGPGNYAAYYFDVDTNRMLNILVIGSFQASGGANNDIDAYIMTDSQYHSWLQGYRATGVYMSGRVTSANLKVSLTVSGRYYIVFSNDFSLISNKVVSAKVVLTWQEYE